MRGTLARIAYVVSFLALAIAYYEFLGAGASPSERAGAVPWWKPAGWARSLDWEVLAPLQEIGADTVQARHEGRFEPRSLIPFALFVAPVASMTALGFALFRSPVARAALLALGLALCAFVYYGWLDVATWQDYGWRWPAVLMSTASAIAVFVFLPALVAAARERSLVMQGAMLLAFFVPIHLLSIEVTGTNPTLQWNLSPWPTVTLYGFLLFGLLIGVVHLAAGTGMLIRERLSDRRGIALGAITAAALAIALRPVPFEASDSLRLVALAGPAALLAALAGRGEGARRVGASAFVVAGLVLLASIKLGQWHAESFLARGRDEIAPQVVAALDRYRQERDAYPASLEDLVPAHLPALRQPHIGWLDWDEEVFTYTDLGDSFLLEFSGPLWVQCAYSPPYEEEVAEAAEAGERLEAAWSCERKPPRLW